MSKPRYRVYANIAKNEPEHHGASNSRRFAGIGVSSRGPNSVLSGALATLRNRSRHAYRNSPLVRKAINSNVINEIGTGIIPRFRSDDSEFNDAARVLFDTFSSECDADGTLNIYGIQSLVSMSRRLAGDVFIRRRNRRLSDGLAVPFQLQVLESDFVPVNMSRTRKNGNIIRQGIEFNNRGKRVAYWMHKSHPGESVNILDSSNYIRVPAKDVIHCYKPLRPGQIRGEPEASNGLLKVTTFEKYDDAELQRKEARAGYTGMLTRESYDDPDFNFDPFTGNKLYDDVDGPEMTIRPGTFLTGLPGEKLQLFDGDNTGSGYKDFIREQKLMIAASHNIPFELMTGDWAGVNDRIYRAFINEYRRGLTMDQDHIMIFQVMRVIIDWFIQYAIISGALTAENYQDNAANYHYVEWRPNAWKHIHPVQDVQSKVMEIENNLNSSDAVVAESGYDAEEIDKQNAEAELRRFRYREQLGLNTNQT